MQCRCPLPWSFTIAMVACTAFGCGPAPTSAPRHQETAISEILALGGSVDVDNPSDPVRAVNLFNKRATDSHVKRFVDLTALETLDLRRTDVGDVGLEALSGLVMLRDLDLTSTRVTDAGLKHLATRTSLEKLHLSNTRVGDEGLRHLSGLTHLVELSLSNTRITNDGLAHLSRLAKLESLSLVGTNVDDDGLLYLRGLTSLRRLDVVNTEVTRAGKVTFSAQLPECTVSYDHRPRRTRRVFDCFENPTDHNSDEFCGPELDGRAP